MSTNNIAAMKKIIEAKKKQSAQQGNKTDKADQNRISQRKAFKTTKRGGFFDK
ncbi:hypothetical protein [Acetobacterium wieringae]|uniref:Uncharacterized protein n=1 Tax=Acetobacterium wieringae TaxID=52694 RepID=A0A1F2PMQ7_9FIRM|nr:hypothetical protein [Acetobacterium wieringae]OFV72021.1 hypothetical protein ACWI_04950 [Acetobacterium wieringae]